MHSIEFIQDMTVLILTSAVVTLIFRRLKQPVVLGYIVAGLIMGPRTPPFSFLHDESIIHVLADLGIILLMFSLGLHFSLKRLKKVGGAALVAGILEILLMFWIGNEMGRFFGWGDMDCVFLGAMLSISSTTIIAKVLQDLGRTREKFAELIFGVLIIEDILAIAILALLSGIAVSGDFQVREVAVTLGKMGIFLVLLLVTGFLTVPRILRFVARFESNELTLITSLALCFGVSLLSIKLGYSEALGAFLIGAIITESKEVVHIETLVEPVRDLFSAIFFVSVGLIIDPEVIIRYALPITVITLAVILGKVISCSFGAYVGGNDTKTSLRVGMGLAQIGEFSFIIASLGLRLKVTSDFLYPLAVTVSALTTLFTPYLIRSSDRVIRSLDRVAPQGLLALLDLYPHWLQNIRGKESVSHLWQKIRAPLTAIGFNLIVVTGIFIGANYVAENVKTHLFDRFEFFQDLNRPCWIAAMLLSQPFLAVSLKKLKDLGHSIAEMSMASSRASPKRRSVFRSLIAHIIFLAGISAIGLLILILSSTMYPQGLVLVLFLLISALILFLFGRSFHRLYSKAESDLTETLAESKGNS
jgi:CPA2 family monovalent cation:H+ antiporter-2